MTTPPQNPVAWFEIPVQDMDRAMKFYETVLDLKLDRHLMGPLEMAWFPATSGASGATGALVKHEWYKPSPNGTLIYFTAPSGNLDTELGRVEAAGGTIKIPRKLISPDHGSMAVLLDTEGNCIALHSPV